MGAVMHLQFSSSLSKFTEANTSFDAGVMRIAYQGGNRNGSFISKEVFEKCLGTIYNCPVVCFYDRETDTIGGHDVALIKGEDGRRYMVNLTTPVGVVPESAKPYWETVTEDDGTEHEYLCVDVLLWKRQEAYQKIKKDGITSESMEINVFDMEKDAETGLIVIRDFEFTAFCLLGSDTPPCFESAGLEVFSQSELKKQVEEMMTELKNSYLEVKPGNGVDDKTIFNLETEGGSDLEDEKKIVEDEPAQEEFSENAEPDAEEPQEQPAEEENFALNSNLRDLLWTAVTDVKVMRPWGMDCRYCMVDFDAELSVVYYEDSRDKWKLFGSPFTMDGDNVVIDFESKTQMKWAIVPFDQGAIETSGAAMLIDRYAEAFESQANQANELNEKFSSAERELQELRRFKEDREESDQKDAIENVFSQFTDLENDEAFSALHDEALADVRKYSVETLEEKCFAIRGRNHVTATFSLKEQKAPKQLVTHEDQPEQDPYNGLFQKYGIVK